MNIELAVAGFKQFKQSVERADLALRHFAESLPEGFNDGIPLDIDELDTDLECWHEDTVLD